MSVTDKKLNVNESECFFLRFQCVNNKNDKNWLSGNNLEGDAAHLEESNAILTSLLLITNRCEAINYSEIYGFIDECWKEKVSQFMLCPELDGKFCFSLFSPNIPKSKRRSLITQFGKVWLSFHSTVLMNRISNDSLKHFLIVACRFEQNAFESSLRSQSGIHKNDKWMLRHRL